MLARVTNYFADPLWTVAPQDSPDPILRTPALNEVNTFLYTKLFCDSKKYGRQRKFLLYFTKLLLYEC